MDDLSLNPVPGSTDADPNPIWARCDLYDDSVSVEFLFETVAARDHARNFGGHEHIKLLLKSALEAAGISKLESVRLWAKDEWGVFRPATDADHQEHQAKLKEYSMSSYPHHWISRGLICTQDKPKFEGPLTTLMKWDCDDQLDVADEYTRDELDAFSAEFLPKLKALLDEGADPNERHPRNYNVPVGSFLAWYLPGVMKVLLDAGARPDVDMDPTTPITDMICTNWQGCFHDSNAKATVFLEALRELARAGADMNRAPVCWYGWDLGSENPTPLFCAIWRERPEIVSLLLELGADPSIKDEKGRDALAYAIDCGNKNIVELLASSDEQRKSAHKRMDNPAHLEIIQTLITRLKTGKEQLVFTLPGFKYEYENEFTISWGADGWVAVEYDGYQRAEEIDELGQSDADLENYIRNKLNPTAPLRDSWQAILEMLRPMTSEEKK